MTYYKAFDNDLSCRGYKFEIGKTFTIKGRPEMCRRGFHCCLKPIDCLRYYVYPLRLCEVSVGDTSETVSDKTVTSQITIIREITGDEFNELLTGTIITVTEKYEDWVSVRCDTTKYYKNGRSITQDSKHYVRRSDQNDSWVETKYY